MLLFEQEGDFNASHCFSSSHSVITSVNLILLPRIADPLFAESREFSSKASVVLGGLFLFFKVEELGVDIDIHLTDVFRDSSLAMIFLKVLLQSLLFSLIISVYMSFVLLCIDLINDKY